jgi:hypothetical protein
MKRRPESIRYNMDHPIKACDSMRVVAGGLYLQSSSVTETYPACKRKFHNLQEISIMPSVLVSNGWDMFQECGDVDACNILVL